MTKNKQAGVILRNPLVIIAMIFILISIYLLSQAINLTGMSSLLPVTMLISMIVLSLIMIIREVIVKRESKIVIFSSRYRFVCAASFIFIYTMAVNFIGFYTATLIMIPSVAYFFGYRNIKGLLLATTIFVGGIALIFLVLMSQEFPAEFFIR